MKELNPQQTNRAKAYELWSTAPMPMVTIIKTLDVTNLKRLSRKGYKFNMLLCRCIGKAAKQIEQFYLMPYGKKLLQYDKLAVSTIVECDNGDIASCDLPYCDDLLEFNGNYLALTEQVKKKGDNYDLSSEYAVIGTSAVVNCEIDGVVNIYTELYSNPFLTWGKYSTKWLKSKLKISFQFHHVQFDGLDAACFLNILQKEITTLKI